MKVELQCGDKIIIPKGCKAIVKDGSVIFEKIQEFKDGDILTHVNCLDYHCPFIYKGTDKNGFHKYHIGLDSLSSITLPNCTNARWGNGTLHHATEEEKQLLFDKMKKQGLQWNAEEKRVERIRWRAKKGERYFLLNRTTFEVDHYYECFDEVDAKLYKYGNYFRTREQAEEAARRMKETLRKCHEETGE